LWLYDEEQQYMLFFYLDLIHTCEIGFSFILIASLVNIILLERLVAYFNVNQNEGFSNKNECVIVV